MDTGAPGTQQAMRGEIFHLLGDPAGNSDNSVHFPDGVLVIENGRIVRCAAARHDPAADTATRFTGLLVPGLVDTHVHYPQLAIMASYGTELLEWLERHTFPVEARFADPEHARREAEKFLTAMLAAGTTTALVFATSHRASAEALFAAAAARHLRLITGKVLSDRNVPATLQDSLAQAGVDTRELIAKWHGHDRLGYAITPRFAPTSTGAQLAMAGELLAAHPGVLLHTHLSENRKEIAWVNELFPAAGDYLAVYEQAGLVTERSVFAHAIHLSQREWQALATAGSGVAFCPCSNLFIGSGLFKVSHARQHGIKLGLGSDVGGGPALSLLRVMDEAYKVARTGGSDIDPLGLWYLATLGGAKVLGLAAHIGNFTPGKEADFIILDPAGQPLLANRLAACTTLEERLFAYAIMGDERCVAATHILGERCAGNGT